jgi:hypothetical protein
MAKAQRKSQDRLKRRQQLYRQGKNNETKLAGSQNSHKTAPIGRGPGR